MAILTQRVLQTWHAAYLDAGAATIEKSRAVNALRNDELDHDDIETQIQSRIRTTLVSAGFCGQCQNLLEHWPILPDGQGSNFVVRHFDSIGIEAAARKKCKLCMFLLTLLKAQKRLELFRKIEARLKVVGDASTASLTIQNFSGNLGTHNININFPGKKANASLSFQNRVQSHVIPPGGRMLWREDLGDFELTKAWLSDCLGSHKNCDQERAGNHSWPSRLVEIQGESARLILTEHLDTLPPYATLSYCWGRKSFTMLRPDNIDSFLDNIKIEDLPSIFQDAFLVMRKIGIRYIWIDALCILQDPTDTTDWAREAGLMRSVYGGSLLNIAASSATSVYGSLLDRSEHHSGGFCARVTAVDDSGTAQYSLVRNFFSSYLEYTESVPASHLASRGWTLQERLLPCRTLYLGERGLFWECQTSTASNFLPDRFPASFVSVRAGPKHQAWDWPTIAQLYSSTDLTYAGDRLPALAGIARRQSELTGDQYLAGLWRKDLEPQLTWRVERLDKRCQRPGWRAPSWSWMSVDGEIRSCRYAEKPSDDPERFVHVLEATVEPAGPDPYGALLGGSMTMACSALIPGHVPPQQPSQDMAETMLIDSGSGITQEIPVVLDCLPEYSECAPNALFLLPVFAAPTGLSVASNAGLSRARCVPECGKEGLNHSTAISGLVLERHGDLKGAFRRVGAWYLLHNPWPELEHWPIRIVPETSQNQYYHALNNALGQVGEATAEAECARVIEEGIDGLPRIKYVITIW